MPQVKATAKRGNACIRMASAATGREATRDASSRDGHSTYRRDHMPNPDGVPLVVGG